MNWNEKISSQRKDLLDAFRLYRHQKCMCQQDYKTQLYTRQELKIKLTSVTCRSFSQNICHDSGQFEATRSLYIPLFRDVCNFYYFPFIRILYGFLFIAFSLVDVKLHAWSSLALEVLCKAWRSTYLDLGSVVTDVSSIFVDPRCRTRAPFTISYIAPAVV